MGLRSEFLASRNKVGTIKLFFREDSSHDNLSIALATYFSSHPDKPDDDDFNDELGWSQWAIDKTNDVLGRIVLHFESVDAVKE